MASISVRRFPSILKSRSYFTYANQISQPLERTPPYVAAREAVECIKSGTKQDHKTINPKWIRFELDSSSLYKKKIDKQVQNFIVLWVSLSKEVCKCHKMLIKL